MFAKVIFVGHLGNDPEMRYTPQGQGVCSFRMAVSRKWGDGQGGTKEETLWVRVSVWGKTAEACSQYLSKGKLVLVEGDRLTLNVYANKEGQPAASLELTAQTVKFLSKGEGGNGQQQNAPADVSNASQSWDEIPF